jgi:hypothetical protein
VPILFQHCKCCLTSFCLVQREADGAEGRMLLAGVLVAAASIAATQGAKLIYQRRAG